MIASVVLLALGGALWLVLVVGSDNGGLRVNGSDIGADVWETLPTARMSQPPRCTPKTDDGIGSWECIFFPGGLVTVEVAEDGSLAGETESGVRLTACCIEVYD